MTFGWLEFHEPFLFPLFQSLEIFLQLLAIIHVGYSQINNCVIREQPNSRVHSVLRHVVYVHQFKRPELLHIIADYDPDIVCLTEITPRNSRYQLEISELQIAGYDSFTNVNDASCHRGVIIYTRTTLHAVPSKSIRDFSESVWCEIPLIAQDRLLLGCIYRSPNSTEENTQILQESMSEMTTGRSHVLITGDFNQPDIDWSDNLSPKDPDCKATDFLESL